MLISYFVLPEVLPKYISTTSLRVIMAGDPVEVRECQSDEAHPRTCIGVSYMDGLVLKAIVLVVSVGAIYGFAGTANRRGVLSVARSGTQLEAITEVGSLDEFDTAVSAAGANVVVIDYSTTWCGPCKFVFPKYEAMSEKYENVVFLKVWQLFPTHTHAKAPSHSTPATSHST